MENPAIEQQAGELLKNPIFEAQIQLLNTVMKLAGWKPGEQPPRIVGGENNTKAGVSVQDVAAATGVKVDTILRHMRDFGHDGFKITAYRHQTGPGSVKGVTVDELPFLVWRLEGRRLKDPRKRLALQALQDMAGDIHRMVSQLPEVKAAIRNMFESKGLTMYQQDENGNFVPVAPQGRELN